MAQKPARNGDKPDPALLTQLVRCSKGEKAVPANSEGAETVEVSALAIGTPRAWDYRRDSGTGEKGTLKDKRVVAMQDQRNFSKMRQTVEAKIKSSPKLSKLGKHVRFVATRDGMRIDLIDDADYSMFDVGTTALVSEANNLIGMIAESIKEMENPIMIRGHTDSLPYGDPRAMNNWMLSSGRAEATRRRLASAGVPEVRFNRIEGVADREPMITTNPTDPRNRRVAITLLYRAGAFGQ